MNLPGQKCLSALQEPVAFRISLGRERPLLVLLQSFYISHMSPEQANTVTVLKVPGWLVHKQKPEFVKSLPTVKNTCIASSYIYKIRLESWHIFIVLAINHTPNF